MRRKITSVFAVLLLIVAGAAPAAAASGASVQEDCSFPVTSTDATDTEVTVEEQPERVTTLAPSAAQTMWEIGGKSQVVGVSQYATYLEGADERTNVSASGQSYVSVEKVVSTEPDLVLAPNVIPNDTVEKLRESGLTVYKFEFATSIEDIYAKTELTGQLTGNCEGASETVASMRDRIETVRAAVEDAERPRVFISIGGGWTAGTGTFVGNMVELAGGSNVAAESNVTGYGQISEEVIVERDPEWIVQVGQYGVYPETDAYNNTTAVRNDQVITVSNENVSQPAPRVVNAIVTMAETFHPEAYEEASATAEATTTEEPTTTATETQTEMQDTEATGDEETTAGAMEDEETTTAGSPGDIPGFGATAALAGLAGAVLLARRR
ncbi:hypothetical protein BRC82_10460 [Halobacteriales archaeon QS_1_67_19]|nr:MAG: hypothetical protein BRC82_10460 [Halobacteriales archaeon QS_1_67_19]